MLRRLEKEYTSNDYVLSPVLEGPAKLVGVDG